MQELQLNFVVCSFITLSPHCPTAPPNHNPIVYASRDEGHEAGRTGMSMTMVSRATPLRTRFIEFLYLPNLVWL